MLQDELKIEVLIRRFLLGEMSEDDRSTFEERFVADVDLFEQTRVVEDELVESYVRGTLDAAEKEKFERAFLTTERRRERVEFTRAMIDKLTGQKEFVAAEKPETAKEKPSVWDSISGFFKMPGLAFGTITSRKRRHGDAPREAAPSSRVFTSMAAKTAMTDRTMKGSVRITCPKRMKAEDFRNSPKPP